MTDSQDTLVFRADNAHAPDSGVPPHIVNGQADLYYGYFENERGEQWGNRSRSGELILC